MKTTNMSAIEFLMEQIKYIDKDTYNEVYEQYQQALEIEKEQIKAAFIQGDMFSVDYYDGINPIDENYYNETYKK